MAGLLIQVAVEPTGMPGGHREEIRGLLLQSPASPTGKGDPESFPRRLGHFFDSHNAEVPEGHQQSDLSIVIKDRGT